MRHTLLNKYLAGETTATEEQELRRLLLSMSQSQLTEEERTVLDLLSYTGEETDEEDIFAVDYTEEYDKVVRPRHTIRLWPYVAAACIAGAMFIFLTPPKEEGLQQGGKQQVAHVVPDFTSTELLAKELPTAREEEPSQPHIVGQPKAERLVAKANIPTSFCNIISFSKGNPDDPTVILIKRYGLFKDFCNTDIFNEYIKDRIDSSILRALC